MAASKLHKHRGTCYTAEWPYCLFAILCLDGPDGWMSGWLLNGTKPQSRIRRQQGGGGVMIWAGIINDAIVGPFGCP